MNSIYLFSVRYDEIARYDFRNHRGNGTVGHFTQVVWKGSQRVGMGVAKVTRNGMNKVYVVARYSPAGNYLGKNRENVMPVKSKVKRTSNFKLSITTLSNIVSFIFSNDCVK